MWVNLRATYFSNLLHFAQCPLFAGVAKGILEVQAQICTLPVLQAFSWNAGPENRRGARQPVSLPELLCPVCSCPLTDDEVQATCQVLLLLFSHVASDC